MAFPYKQNPYVYRDARFSDMIDFVNRKLKRRAFRPRLNDADADGLSFGVAPNDPLDGDCVNTAICAGVGKLPFESIKQSGFKLKAKADRLAGYNITNLQLPSPSDPVQQERYENARKALSNLSSLVWGKRGIKPKR